MAGALGGNYTEPNARSNKTNRSNQTSSNSPFATSETAAPANNSLGKSSQPPGGRSAGGGNIINWQ